MGKTTIIKLYQNEVFAVCKAIQFYKDVFKNDLIKADDLEILKKVEMKLREGV